MPNNELIERPKLGLFQRIRKAFLIRKINGDKYEKAPDYLKNDPDVIESLMSSSYTYISHLSDEHALEYLSRNPDIFKNINRKLQDSYLKKNPELFTHLYDFQQLERIFEDKSYEYLKYLSQEEQLEYLTQKTSKYATIKDRIPYETGIRFESSSYQLTGGNSGNIITTPSYFADKLEFFDESVLFKAIEIHRDAYNEKYKYSNDKDKREAYFTAESFYKSIDLKNMSQETKLKLALLDTRMLSYCDPETVEKYVNGNPLLLDMLPKDKKIEIVKSNPSFIKMISDYQERKNLISLCPGTLEQIDYKYKSFQDVQRNVNYEEVIKIAALSYDSYYQLSKITDSVRNPDMLWEISKTIPQALSITGITDRFTSGRKQMHVKDLFKSKISNPVILNAIEQSKYFGYNVNNYDEMQINAAICKVLTDEKLTSTCDPEKIAEFVKNPTFDGMKGLIVDTYGENAKKVLDSRPGLTLENIPNLKIFDPVIFDKFGEGVVHNQLSYDTKFSIILADFANHPEKIEEYKKFERLTDGLFIQNAAGNEEKYSSFLELFGLLSKLDEKDMTPERILALKMAITDRKLPETRTIPLESLEDLDSYIVARNKMYDEALQKVTDIEAVKDLTSKRFFGMSYGHGVDPYYRASTLNLQGMIHYYSVDNLLNDKRTHESDLFNRDELDSIELASIISKINDPKVLKEIYSSLAGRDNVIGPVEFEAVKQKIPLQYSRELVSQLLTPEKAIEMAEKGDQGVSIEHSEEGVDIIKLQGADFKIMMHSFITSGQTNSGLHIPYGAAKDKIWKYFEEGCSTISNCLIEPNMLKSCGSDGNVVNFGFSNIDPRLIIGMSHHDAHVSHSKGAPDPHFEFTSVKMNYPEELLRRTAAQITGQEAKDASHEYNEVTTYRNEQDPSKVTSENIGGKIMPDYLVVYGKPNAEQIRLAKEMGKDGKPLPIILIDRNYYRDGMYFRANQKDTEHQIEEKQDSEFIKEVKEVIEKSDEDIEK